MDQRIVVARALAQLNPNLYREYQDQVTPMLTNTRHIADMLQAIQSNHPELDQTDTRIFFTALVYDAYCPASFLPKAAQRLPIGIRDEAARVLGYSNPENINSWRGIAAAYMKNPKFRLRVNAIKETFKQFSVRKEDWQLGI